MSKPEKCERDTLKKQIFYKVHTFSLCILICFKGKKYCVQQQNLNVEKWFLLASFEGKKNFTNAVSDPSFMIQRLSWGVTVWNKSRRYIPGNTIVDLRRNFFCFYSFLSTFSFEVIFYEIFSAYFIVFYHWLRHILNSFEKVWWFVVVCISLLTSLISCASQFLFLHEAERRKTRYRHSSNEVRAQDLIETDRNYSDFNFNEGHRQQ